MTGYTFKGALLLILFTGCWHAHPAAATLALNTAKDLGITTIIQTGDFLYNEEGKQHIVNVVRRWHQRNPSPNPPHIYGIRGNHDNPAMYHSLPPRIGSQELRFISPYMTYIPDGTTLNFGGRTFGFLGGAHSVDRAYRNNNEWWENETTNLQALKKLATTPLHVLVTHDMPAPVTLINPTPPDPNWDITGAQAHSQLFVPVIDGARPHTVINGHMHTHQTTHVNYPTGEGEFHSIILDHGHYTPVTKTPTRTRNDFIHILDTERIPQ